MRRVRRRTEADRPSKREEDTAKFILNILQTEPQRSPEIMALHTIRMLDGCRNMQANTCDCGGYKAKKWRTTYKLTKSYKNTNRQYYE